MLGFWLLCLHMCALPQAGKYVAKPEKNYKLETTHNSVRDFLDCRTIGLPICVSRLQGYHVVRSTHPCVLACTKFVREKEWCMPRDDGHKAKYPEYPLPEFYISKTQQYFFRHHRLRQLRRAPSGRMQAQVWV